MSSTQSLQSCLEPLLLEPRDLMHQLLPSKSLLSFQKEKAQHYYHHSSLSKQPSLTNKNGQEPSCGHPLSAKTTFRLSSKSLEMCTESLGSETGSGIDQCSLLASVVEEELQSREAKRQQQMKKAKHGGGNLKFPPPLTSISGGGGGLQVQSRREDGRLVMKAFSLSSTFFQAERGDGRLRLSLLKQGAEEEDGGGDSLGENVKEDGGRVWSRCNGESSSSRSKRLQQSLPFCVVGV